MAHGTQTASERLADLILGDDGPLERFVRSRRDDGKSWRRIARDLYVLTEHEVDVSDESLRSWFPDPEQASA